MRVILNESGFSPPCGNYDWGETQDFTVNIIGGDPCTDPPVPGSAVSSKTEVCNWESFQLSLSGHSTGSGQTYQWQSSADGIDWTNIPNATNSILSTTQEEESWYRAIVSCGSSETSEAVHVGMLPLLECYCISSALNENDTRITNVTLNTLDVSSPSSCAVYTDYTHFSTDLIAGESYNISVTHGTCGGFYSAGITVYIDFYQNGTFTQNDEVFRFGPTTGLGPVSGIITVPSDAVPGSTRMRVIISEDDFEPPCGNYDWGETQDYTVNIIGSSPCIDPPIPGSAVSSHTEVCIGESFQLSLSGHSIGSGQTYQWQASADGIDWTNIPDATNSILNTTQIEESWYRAIVSCGSSEISEAVHIGMLPLLECYCSSTALVNDDTRITNVTLNTLDVSSPSSCAVYTDYTHFSTDLTAGESYNISVTHGTCGGFFRAYLTVYIDFYQNGTFTQNDEVFRFGPTNSLGPISGTISIPSDAVSGPTWMRIILSEDLFESPCGTYTYGETQDFTVNIERPTNVSDQMGYDYDFKIFPNHASDLVTISLLSPNATDYQLVVYDILGRLKYSKSGNLEREFLYQLDISDWPVGQYMVNMMVDGKQFSRKLIVSR